MKTILELFPTHDHLVTAKDVFAAVFQGVDHPQDYPGGILPAVCAAALALRHRASSSDEGWQTWEREGFRDYRPVETRDWLADWYANSAGGSVLADYRVGRFKRVPVEG